MQTKTFVLALLATVVSAAAVPRDASDAATLTKRVKVGDADFGKCNPTIDFKAGRPGRKATESTFLPTDPLVAKGQQDALNPNIITRRVCDQLTNVCGANAAAKAKCKAAEATVARLGTKDASTAAAFNKALGL